MEALGIISTGADLATVGLFLYISEVKNRVKVIEHILKIKGN